MMSLIVRMICAAVLLFAMVVTSQGQEGWDSWQDQQTTTVGGPEADLVIRIGDIDNFGQCFPESYNPFEGLPGYHGAWPYLPVDGTDMTDRVITGSPFTPRQQRNSHVMSGTSKRQKTSIPKRRSLRLRFALTELVSERIQAARIQMFVLGLSGGKTYDRFKVTLNSLRFKEMEYVLNRIVRQGPIGRMLDIDVPLELIEELRLGEVRVEIVDDTHDDGGLAVDFVRLLVNPKPSGLQRSVSGRVIERGSGKGIDSAYISKGYHRSTVTTNGGMFTIDNANPGIGLIVASARGYSKGYVVTEIETGGVTPSVTVELRRATPVKFRDYFLYDGDSINVSATAFFDKSTKLSTEARQFMVDLGRFLRDHPYATIDVVSYSRDYDSIEENKRLSEQRSRAAKTFLVSSGIDESRIRISGKVWQKGYQEYPEYLAAKGILSGLRVKFVQVHRP